MNRTKGNIGRILAGIMSLVLICGCCGCFKAKTGSKAEENTFEASDKKVKAGTYTWSEYLDKNNPSIWYDIPGYYECGKDTLPKMVYAFSDGKVLRADLGLTLGELSRMEDSEILEKVKELSGKPTQEWIEEAETEISNSYHQAFMYELKEMSEQGNWRDILVNEEELLDLLGEKMEACPSDMQIIWQNIKAYKEAGGKASEDVEPLEVDAEGKCTLSGVWLLVEGYWASLEEKAVAGTSGWESWLKVKEKGATLPAGTYEVYVTSDSTGNETACEFVRLSLYAYVNSIDFEAIMQEGASMEEALAYEERTEILTGTFGIRDIVVYDSQYAGYATNDGTMTLITRCPEGTEFTLDAVADGKVPVDPEFPEEEEPTEEPAEEEPAEEPTEEPAG